MTQKALQLGVPISAQLDLTYRCNEKCVHCYLDHEDHGEMTTAEIKDVLDQMAAAGVFFLTLSGGEILMRKDFFEILTYAAKKTFCIKLKTNAMLIREREAKKFARSAWNPCRSVFTRTGRKFTMRLQKFPARLRAPSKQFVFCASKGYR